MNGHYVCNECHTKGMDAMIGLCLKETSKDPVAIIKKLMDQPFCHMHGPEHHVMVGAALLTAYKNAGGDIELHQALAVEPFGLSHLMTSKALEQIGTVGGPRCCKRDSFLSILAAVDFVEQHFQVSMEKTGVVCGYSAQNNQCIGKRCPFSK